MRTMKSVLAAAALMAAVPAVANAQWYVGLDAGANFHEDSDGSAAGNSSKLEFDWGYVGLGQVGYNFGGPKVEFEVGYRTNDVKSGTFNGNNANSSGDVSQWSFMVNGIYEFLPNSSWHPFLGAGVGAAHVDGDSTFAGLQTKVDDWQFAYQGIAGVAYDVDTNWALKAQYRYFNTLDVTATTAGRPDVELDNHNHSILVGFTYKFAAAPAPVAAPVPVAAPAPTPAPAPVVKAAPALQKNFLVFFDFNKADVTPEAQKIVAQAAGAAKQGNAARVSLTGHADRSGSDKYNQALSLKRANAVKDALVKQGIPADQISVVGKGESDPLVATPDGVREPQNRRVEIVLP